MPRMRLMGANSDEFGLREDSELQVPSGENALDVIVTGLRGSGKTTLAESLVSHFNVARVRAYNTRPARPSDPIDENVRVSNDEFWALVSQGKILQWTDASLSEELFWDLYHSGRMSEWDSAIRYTVNSDGSVYFRATPVLEDWIARISDTEIRLFVCGPEFALKAFNRLPLINPRVIFLDGSELKLLENLRKRPWGNDYLGGHIVKNKQHKKSGISAEFLGNKFMHVINIDAHNCQQVLDEVVAFLGDPYRNRLLIAPP